MGLGTAAVPYALASRANAGTPAPAPRRGGTFTMAQTMGVTEFNPFFFTGHYSFKRALFNTLARYDSQLRLQPELAEKWEFSADGKQVTLKLRQGVKFHSGREFTSTDVKNSWEFAIGDKRTTMRVFFAAIKGVETPDKYTAILNFDTVNPGIFDILDGLYVIDKENIKEASKVGAGTGPFKFDRYVPNDRVEMSVFKDYWDKGKPYLDKFVVRTIPDLSSMAINLETGTIDCAWQPNFVDLVRLKSLGGKYLVDMGAPGAAMWNLAYNVKAEPFTNKKVRQAITWSIDRVRFCRTVAQGLIEPTCLMWPTHSWAYFKDLEGSIGYDLDKARLLLKEAGFANGFDTDISVSAQRYPGSTALALILQNDLKKIGVNMKISDMEGAVYDSAVVAKGDMRMTVLAYARLNRDPGTLVSAAKAWLTDKEGTWTHFESAEYDKMRRELNSTLDQEKRKPICRKIQELALDECFTNPIAYQQRPFAYASYLKGFGYDMDNSPLVADFWLDK